MRYLRLARAYVQLLERLVRELVLPVAQATAREVRTDSLNDLHDAIDRVQEQIGRVALAPELEAVRASVSDHVDRDLSRVLKIDVRRQTGVDAASIVFVQKNVALIRSVSFDQLGKMREVVDAWHREGSSYEELRNQLMDTFALPRARAALIARDQTLKLNSDLTRHRHEQVGITHYKWSSSHDERVRAGHRALDGKVFAWADPPVVDPRSGRREPPGRDFQCRCVAIPQVDHLLDDEPAGATPPVVVPGAERSRLAQERAAERARRAEARAAKKAARELEAERARLQKPEAWVDRYTPRYGRDVARKLAWGRAAEERVADLPVDKFLEKHKAARRTRGAGRFHDADLWIEQAQEALRAQGIAEPTMRQVVEHLEESNALQARQVRAHMAVIGHVEGIRPPKRPVSKLGLEVQPDPNVPEALREHARDHLFTPAAEAWEALADRSVAIDWKQIELRYDGTSRAHYDHAGRYVQLGNGAAKIAAHEFAHAWEHQHGLEQLAHDFVRARATGPLTALGEGYEAHEAAWPDEFWDPYVGAHYMHGGRVYASEVTSMAIQELFASPETLATHDLDHLHFVLGLLSGGKAP